jgi:superoxide dismutase
MDPMRTFLTEENINVHKEYMKTLHLRHSIVEKSIPEIKGKNIFEIERMRLKKTDREEILSTLSEYLAHEIYFKSFTITQNREPCIREYYSSEEAFLYEVFIMGMNAKEGFVFIHLNERGKPEIQICQSGIKTKYLPKLAIDLCEHAYFLDYRFEKERYLKNALSHLDLSLLTSDKTK